MSIELERVPKGPEPLYQRLFAVSAVPITHSELKSLAEGNPGTEIINSKTIATRFGPQIGFQPSIFQPVDVVIVSTKDGPDVKILDGHHRTHMALRQYPKPEDMPEGFAFLIRNMTANSLLGLDIDPETVDQPPMLTPFQYGEVLIVPTKEQPEIATERMAGHFIDVWNMALGTSTREKIPLLLALGLVAVNSRDWDSNFGLYDRVKLEKDEKDTIFTSMDEMSGIVGKMGVPINKIIAETTRLLVKKYDEPEAERNVIGIFDLPQIHNQFSKRNIHIKGELVSIFVKKIREHLQREGDKPGVKFSTTNYIENVLSNLRNGGFFPMHMRRIISSSDPSAMAGVIEKQLRKERREQEYRTVIGRRGLTSLEDRLLNVPHLPVERINEIAATIADAEIFLREKRIEPTSPVVRLYRKIVEGSTNYRAYSGLSWNQRVTELQKALDGLVKESDDSVAGKEAVVYEERRPNMQPARGAARELLLQRRNDHLERALQRAEGDRDDTGDALGGARRTITSLRNRIADLEEENRRLRGEQSE